MSGPEPAASFSFGQPNRFDVYLHVDITNNSTGDPRIGEVLAAVQRLELKIGEIMATMQEVLDEVTAQTTKLDSVIALIDGLKSQLADLLSGVVVPPAVQAQIDNLFSQAKTNAAKISDALDENVEPPPASAKKK
jgi:ABC-type transporter Mla subunit MlaD